MSLDVAQIGIGRTDAAVTAPKNDAANKFECRKTVSGCDVASFILVGPVDPSTDAYLRVLYGYNQSILQVLEGHGPRRAVVANAHCRVVIDINDLRRCTHIGSLGIRCRRWAKQRDQHHAAICKRDIVRAMLPYATTDRLNRSGLTCDLHCIHQHQLPKGRSAQVCMQKRIIIQIHFAIIAQVRCYGWIAR